MKRIFDRWFLPAALILGAVNGCSGWGSSGPKSASSFDQAFSVEQEAIDQVTQEGGCVDVEDGTIVCAPDESISDGRSPEIEALVIDPPSGSQIACETLPDEDACVFTLAIRKSGFPDGTQYYAAVRIQDKKDTWESGLSPFLPSGDDPKGMEVQVRVTGLSGNDSIRMQLAALVFLPESDLPPLSTGDLLLRDFAADRSYVVDDITVAATPSE